MLLLAGCSRPGRIPQGGEFLDGGGPVIERSITPVVERRPRVIEVITSAGDVRGAAKIEGGIWLATSGGVVRAAADLVEEARFTTLDGLPSNDTWAITLHGDRVFVATADGVARARLDAGRLVDIERLGEREGLRGRRIRDLAIVEGVLHAGAFGGGVARYSGGRFEALDLGPAADRVTRLRSDGPRLWVATAGGGVARVFAGVPRWFSTRDGLDSDLVWDVLTDGEGALVATTGGLSAIRGEKVDPLPIEGDLRALGRTTSGLLAGTFGNGLLTGDDGRGELPVGLLRLRALIALDGELLACAEDGAALLDHEGRVIARWAVRDLPSPDVTALAAGRDALYAGTFDRGVARMRIRPDTGARVIDRITAPEIDSRVNALAVRLRGESVGDRRRAASSESNVGDRRRAASSESNEELWIGTARGVVRWQDGRATRFTVAQGLPDDHVNALLAEPEAVWVATTRGLARISDAGVERISPENGLPVTRLSSLARGSDGALWIGAAHGVARLAADGRTWTRAHAHLGDLPDDFVTAVASDGGTLWVGTFSSGIARFASGAWSISGESDGLPCGWINPGAIASHGGRIWFGTVERGLQSTSGDGRWRVLGVGDGLPSPDVTALAADDGGLWVATRGGIARVPLPQP
ncbi:MAG: hypothetical protein EXR72_00235 [Myxococcales bacterium]|nr:hypothetical protein [Myxococcales bacterium]